MYPAVDRINPIFIPRTTRITYAVISDGYFNTRQKAALTQTLEAAFTDVAVKVNLRTDKTYRGPENSLAVEVEPTDSLGGQGSFKVFETLRRVLQPHRPHAAVGYWMRRAPTPPGTYVLGFRFLGLTHEAAKKLTNGLKLLPSVKQLFSAPTNDASYHFFLVVEGDPLEKLDENPFRRELREFGCSLMVTNNDQRWDWQIIGLGN